MSKKFSSVWPIDSNLSGAATLGQREPGSDGNKGILGIHENFSITGASPSGCLVSYPGHPLGESDPFAAMLYSTDPID